MITPTSSIPGIVISILAATALVTAEAGDLTARPADDGGFIVEGAKDIANNVSPNGIASAPQLESLVRTTFSAPNAKAYSAGKALNGAYEITVARADGALKRYPAAENVVVFVRGDTMNRSGDRIALEGAVVFSRTADARGDAQQRMDHGDITLVRLGSDDI